MKGVLILLGMIAVAVVFCGIIPFVVMPGLGVGVALPVIMVPGEVVWEDFLGIEGLTVTNTVIGTVVADIVLLIVVYAAVRNLKEVPGRTQGLFEVLTDALYGLSKSTAGRNARTIFPLMATIFLFLLVANWIKLVPGAESIGLMHCAHDGVNGYEKRGIMLEVTEPLNSGVRATEENYEACHDKKEGHTDPALKEAREVALVEAATLLDRASLSWKDDVGNGNTLADYVSNEGGDPDAVYAETLAALEAEADVAEDEADPAEEGEAAHEEGDEEAHGPRSPDELADAAVYDTFWRDDIYAVTPFVRGAATDLNLTLGLGLFAVIAVQIYGVQALGMSYFTKFVNTPALGNATENPMGIMDFIVGLLEIITEVAKVLSFGFRLFGNLFAGGVLLFVMAFLVSMLVPAGVYALELFIGLIQAFVFAILLLVFAAMAMEGHHDEVDHH